MGDSISVPSNDVWDKRYNETAIRQFGYMINLLLTSSMEERNLSGIGPGIILDAYQVRIPALPSIQMNTPRQVLAILGVSASIYDSEELVKKRVIRIPKDVPISELTPKQYYLFLAYNMLVHKISQRDTHLFRVLFMLVCLELWRESVSTEVIAGPIGENVDFGDLVWTMMGRNSKLFIREFSENGYPTFANFLVGYLGKIAHAKFGGKRSIARPLENSFSHAYMKQLLDSFDAEESLKN